MLPISAIHKNFVDMKECSVFYSVYTNGPQHVVRVEDYYLFYVWMKSVMIYIMIFYIYQSCPLFILNYYMPAYRDSDEIAGAVIGTLLGGTILVLVIIYFVRNYCHHKRQASPVRSGGTIAIFCTGKILVYLGYDDKSKNLNFIGSTIITIS